MIVKFQGMFSSSFGDLGLLGPLGWILEVKSMMMFNFICIFYNKNAIWILVLICRRSNYAYFEA